MANKPQDQDLTLNIQTEETATIVPTPIIIDSNDRSLNRQGKRVVRKRRTSKYEGYDLKAVAQRFRERRLLLRLTQEEVANFVGVKQAYYSTIETAKALPMDLATGAAKALGMSIEYALYGTGTPPAPAPMANQQQAGLSINNSENTNVVSTNENNDHSIYDVSSSDVGQNTGFINKAVESGSESPQPINSSQSIVNNQNTYNFSGSSVNYPNMGFDTENQGINGSVRYLPVLDADLAVSNILDRKSTPVSNFNGTTIFVKVHGSNKTVAVHAQDKMPEYDGCIIDKKSTVIVDPLIVPYDQSLVLVCLDATSAWRRSLFAVLSIDITGKKSIKISTGETYDMPQDSIICGVAVDIIRNIVSPATQKQRADQNWDVWATHQK